MKLLLSIFVLSAAVFASTVDEAATIQNVLDTVALHTKTNHKFSELEAAVLNAMESKEEISGRSPMAEIAAMTDMLIIEAKDNLEKETKSYHTLKQQLDLDKKSLTEDIGFFEDRASSTKAEAEKCYLSFSEKNAKIEQHAKEKDVLIWKVKNEEDMLQQAKDARAQAHIKYIALINEHDSALKDVKVIRQIVQNSALDGRAGVTATVSNGNTNANPGLLELRKTVHPRLNNIVLLAHKATTQSSGIDLIYKLLHETRDQIQESKNKIVKDEKTTKAAYKNTHLAFIEDIGSLWAQIASVDITISMELYQVFRFKSCWAKYWCVWAFSSHQAMQKEFELTDVNFDLKKSHYFWSVNTAAIKNEKEALEKVAQMLVDLKWSTKVYNAIANVNLGIVYLHGNYNIRSALSRYMTVYTDPKSNKTYPRFDAQGAQHYAGQFEFQLQKGDLSYYIVYKTLKDPTKDFHKDTNKVHMQFYLTQNKDEVEFVRVPNDYSKWNMFYHTESGRMFITNQKTTHSLFVHQKDSKYTVNTLQQSKDIPAQFYIERVEYSLSGCYKWREAQKLNRYQGASEEQNTDRCYESCKKLVPTGLKYFGLRSGKQCYCGTDDNFSKEVAPLAECGYLCPGRDGDLCGGPMRIIVHEVKGTVKKETVVQRYKQEFCPKGYTTTGGPGADIAGCGLGTCDTSVATIQLCATACTTNAKCHAYSFAPVKADPGHADTTVCTMYSQTVPNKKLINPNAVMLQSFCIKETKA